jgi:hypothetical protein
LCDLGTTIGKPPKILKIMKIASTIIVASLCLVTVVNAQPVFTSAQVPTAGSILTFGSATIPAPFEINAGPSQTWNFNNTISEESLTMEFLNPAMVPAAEAVEGCNLVMKTSSNGFPEPNYDFVIINQNAWSSLANSSSPDMIEDLYETPDTLFRFPLNDQSDFSNANVYSSTYYVGSPESDSMRYVSRTITRNLVDAWGTLNINGSAYSVLKLRQTSSSTDSTYSYANGVWTYVDASEYEDESHLFVCPEAGGIVMSVSLYEDDFGQTQWFVFYMLSNTITRTTDVAKDVNFKLYPNPTSSNVNIAFPGNEFKNQTVRISDISGKVVNSQSLNAISNAQLDVSSLSKGVYFVSLPGANSSPQKLIIQ